MFPFFLPFSVLVIRSGPSLQRPGKFLRHNLIKFIKFSDASVCVLINFFQTEIGFSFLLTHLCFQSISGKQSLFHFPAQSANHDKGPQRIIPFRISSERRNTHTISHRKYMFGSFTWWKKYKHQVYTSGSSYSLEGSRFEDTDWIIKIQKHSLTYLKCTSSKWHKVRKAS